MSVELLRELKDIVGALCILEDGRRFPEKYQGQQSRIVYAKAQAIVGTVATIAKENIQ